jgi:phage repressor protein C with HTH and peptisase S24 domain
MNSFTDIVEEIKSIISSEVAPKKVFDKDVAAALGISQMNFATMKKRNRIPFNELLDFCAKRSISINWLLYGQSPESLVEATNKYYMVKYFSDINASAGGGSDAEIEEIEELEIPEQFVFMLGGEKELKNIEAINVSGDSMEPTFSYNDIVFINRAKTDINRGGIFTIRTEAGLFIKRVQKRLDGKLDVISDNAVYNTQTLDQNEIEVIGRVVSRFGDVD